MISRNRCIEFRNVEINEFMPMFISGIFESVYYCCCVALLSTFPTVLITQLFIYIYRERERVRDDIYVYIERESERDDIYVDR